MNKVVILVVSIIFGVLFMLNYFIWKPVEEVETAATKPTVTPVRKMDAKALIDNPPTLSIKGEIKELSGDVKWESRADNEFIEIDEPQTIQQGERIATKDGGSVEVMFEEDILVQIGEESELYFVQTLPGQFVLGQSSGTVNYTNKETSPLSVRASHLIILLTKGQMEVNRDNEEETISVRTVSGTVEIAYNNVDFESQIVELSAGEVFYFDIEEREGEML